MTTKLAKIGVGMVVVLAAWLLGSLNDASFVPDIVPDVAIEEDDRSPALLIDRLERETLFVGAQSDLVHEVDVDRSSTVAGWRVPWTSSRTTWRLVGLAEATIDLSEPQVGTRAGGSKWLVTIPLPEVTVTINPESTEGYRCDRQPIAQVTGADCANVDQLMDEAAADMTVTAFESGIVDEAKGSFEDWIGQLGGQFGLGPVGVLWVDPIEPVVDAAPATTSTTVEVAD
jgi:hypothetical protein